MNIKVKLVAEIENKNDKGEVVKEIVKDAIPAKDLDGKVIAIKEIGKNLSNMLYVGNVPQSVTDVIAFKKFCERFHDNNGEEFEMDEAYIEVIKDLAVRTQSVYTAAAIIEFFDKALLNAKNKSSKSKK